MKQLLTAILMWLTLPAYASETQQLLQLLDYVGVDYAEAVENGKIINRGEYNEMVEFSSAISESIATLPWSEIKPALKIDAQQLVDTINARQQSSVIIELTAAMRRQVMNAYEVVSVPGKAPDTLLAQQLYQENCAACHGETGLGDGTAANGMEPAPTNFLDIERHRQRTLFGLYNTITLGVSETGMRPFNELSDHERWSLAFYVGALPYTNVKATSEGVNGLNTLQQITTTTPADAELHFGTKGLVALSTYRNHPGSLFRGKRTPLTLSRELLASSLQHYVEGDHEQAQKLAVTAYLEGFEMVEATLSLKAPELSKEIETEMGAYRNDLRKDLGIKQATKRQQQIDVMLAVAHDLLMQKSLSSGSAFGSAFIILLREGLEAILVLAALMAVLIKTGRRDGLPYLHAGWVLAVIAGAATWWVSTYLLTISGALREMSEGIAALTAAGILFFVGFWMHSKTNAVQWKKFIDQTMGRALGSGTLWSLAGLSFISVYREMFETILFYQAIWVQTDAAGHNMVITGMISATAVLLVVAWLVMRYSTQLPLRQFFGFTGLFLFIMAVIFAGKGIEALQEAGNIPSDPLNMPFIELVGLSNNTQGLLIQCAMIAVTVGLIWGRRVRSNAVA
ncbi:hypothetical protein BOW53_05005 [Solemya pervernicosa gill symbiont]|uniref:Cytochrome c domain-containing protein n=2 Tax=Gammaproteobacteria incertae sedis TaxID=118884 RepID=A0A1T2L7N6_9GAMM|nr:cytochrome c/FTR1 family iron permease [Candidatus Reidiella endopervernicosa]OOZ41093.1 hypothetical protein BOW53_05005 [Solemya pervernicosa gill symbiont]QKQ26254.1 FTR1 family protein [Candidatus Reidiella endopervernicosa]